MRRIENVPWSAEAEARMQDPAGAVCLPYLRDEVERGVSLLWHCQDGASEAYIITRIDHNPDALVIAYCEGSDIAKFADAFIRSAHSRGVPLRIHTTKPGMCRYLRRFGLEVQEFVLRTTPPSAAAAAARPTRAEVRHGSSRQ